MERTAKLFENFSYGMPKADIIRLANAGACPAGPKNGLILCAASNVRFLDWDWQEIFRLNNADALQEVILSRPNNEDVCAIAAALDQAGWTPVCLETGDAVYDVFDPAARSFSLKKEIEAAYGRMKENEETFTLYFFPADFAAAQLEHKKVTSYSQAIDNGGDNFVMLSMMVNADYLKIAFTAPVMSRKEALKYGEMIKRSATRS